MYYVYLRAVRPISLRTKTMPSIVVYSKPVLLHLTRPTYRVQHKTPPMSLKTSKKKQGKCHSNIISAWDESLRRYQGAPVNCYICRVTMNRGVQRLGVTLRRDPAYIRHPYSASNKKIVLKDSYGDFHTQGLAPGIINVVHVTVLKVYEERGGGRWRKHEEGWGRRRRRKMRSRQKKEG